MGKSMFEKVEELRRDYGLTQVMICRFIGCDVVSFCRYKNGYVPKRERAGHISSFNRFYDYIHIYPNVASLIKKGVIKGVIV